jgi:MoaA/NifB/PqqE/SkfB family radical SAM enzyme
MDHQRLINRNEEGIDMQRHTLAISVTNRCPLRCDFCCVPPGPGDLEKEKARELIDQAISLGVFRSVGFTGGEPMLRLPLVEELGTKLANAGIS